MSTSPAPHSLGAGLSGPRGAGPRSAALLVALGAAEIVLGLIAIVWPAVALIWANLPSSASWAIGLLVGLHFLVAGVRTAWSGFELRREKRSPGIREGALSRA
jgi:uncharacterized membrane protein HdeD (DUF308 family)